MLRHLAAAVAASLLAAAAAARAAEKSFPLPDGGGQVTLSLPDGWTADADGGTPPTVTARGPAGQHASVQMTPLPTKAKPTDDQLKALAVTVGRAQFLKSSTEKKVVPEAVKGDHVRGTTCSFTDSSADPGEFKCVTAGAVAIDDHLFTVTVLCDAKTGAAHDAAMKIVGSARLAAAAAAAAAAGGDAKADTLRVASPDGTWAVLVPGQWQVAANDVRGGKQRQLMATDPGQNGWTLSVFVEPAAKPAGTAKVAREFYVARMQRNPLGMKNLKRTEAGGNGKDAVAIVEYDQGMAGVTEHAANAYFSRGGSWVDVHVSKVDFDPAKDRAALDAILNGLKLDPPAVADVPAGADPATVAKPKGVGHGD